MNSPKTARLVPAEDLAALAAETLRVLDLQQAYFKSRNPADLVAAKAAEATLRAHCRTAAAQAAAPAADLFSGGPPE